MRKMNNPYIKIVALLTLISLLVPFGSVKAQTPTTSGPVYIVQEGDSLWDIAYRFHVSQADLANANGITNYNQISVGQQLVIPGLEGIQGVLTTEKVAYGETLTSLSRRYHLSLDVLERLNHVTSPNEIYSGYFLVILEDNASLEPNKRADLVKDLSLFELSILNDTSSWAVLANNQLSASSAVVPGDILRVPGVDDSGPGGLPPAITSVSISALSQGQTGEVEVDGVPGTSLQGSLMSHPLNFFTTSDQQLVALQGIHAMAEPGLFALAIQGSSPDGSNFDFSQNVLISAGDFLYDIPLNVDPETLDPAVTGPEDQTWRELASQASPEKLWNGVFTLPVEPVFADCYASRFGSRRSYNGSDYSYYHTGLDYCGQVGDPIYASASGEVVFAGPLTVRGNATMIDHGWGVFSAYLHQSEILVKVGDHVEQGQLIGRVGNTGRVEGPHLHFEIQVGGVPVDPIAWLTQEYP
jgi:murein DD-endopeptidase MepM/ murein hydrolase activator NlpD